MYHRFLPLIFFMAFIAGCGSQPTGPASDPSFIMPLKVGNQWIGRWTLYREDGSVISATLDTLSIIAEQKVGGETRFRGSDGALYLNRKDGLWVESQETGDRLVLHAKYPAAVGDTFSAERVLALLPGGTGPLEVTIAMAVLDTAGMVDTGAGSYRCHIYQPRVLEYPEIALGDRGRRRYYAPDVGPVRIDWPDGSRTWELVKATIL